ncbi:major facilitator superfamily domain-containing protein [Pyronema domesticum]|uniref:Similar to Putative tartrate transporter acc. no. P70786 n=1 Tax=Pyronema omphalodes (strain CBS 100304) TaxID=1076935 RepID=U4LHL5_PYROM|nr:major facilitator superfamily domain-containing protein [Pyronema domesticum]CCX11561.1 Similar to Putative tartrate transporter; acc. no. P70786 [Pyronema omphalodes CBS 100304]
MDKDTTTTALENASTKSNQQHVEHVPPESLRGISPEEHERLEQVLVRKIDMRLMPMLVIMYIMNYLDRNNIAAARLAGLEQELKLTSTQYQLSVSILFVGYILMQVPSNMFLDKIGRPSLYLPTAMVIWGIISGATAGVTTFGGLIACRFVLGIIEAAYFPGCLFFLSSWYTRKELGFRTAILYSGSLISGAFSGLITAGITDGMNGLKGLLAWRWLFIVEGAATVVIAVTAYWVLPDFPKSTKWLTTQERDLAVWRLEQDVGEADWEGGAKENIFHGLKLAFTDGKTYVLGAILFGEVSSGSVTNFFPTVVLTLGYNPIISLLLTAPPYVVAVITTFLNSYHADKTGERYYHVTLPLWVSIAAFILAAATTATGPRYLAMMLMVPSVYSGYVVSLAWISNTLPRPPAKRAAALAAINAFSNASSIWTAFAYPRSSGPRYIEAMAMNCATAALSILAATGLRWHLARKNKKLDNEGVDGYRYLL